MINYALNVTNSIGHEQKRAFAKYGREQDNYTQYYISDYFEYLQGQMEKMNTLLVRLLGIDHSSRVPNII